MKKTMIPVLALAMALMIAVMALAGCGAGEGPVTGRFLEGTKKQDLGGVLCLRVNPEIAVHYDAQGNVTELEARNEDGSQILMDFTGYLGKGVSGVVVELVNAIGQEGYFVEEVEGMRRQIVLELEPGSVLPSELFLEEVARQVQVAVDTNAWNSPIEVKNERAPGYTDYADHNSSGTVPPGTIPPTQTTLPSQPAGYQGTDYGVTDYNDTDYGPNNDGVTDYFDTDYGPNSDGATDYDDTDYGPGNDGVTDYHDTDYGNHGSHGQHHAGATDYDDGYTDYGRSDYGDTDYGFSDYGHHNGHH